MAASKPASLLFSVQHYVGARHLSSTFCLQVEVYLR
jgi:hypothetical protein